MFDQLKADALQIMNQMRKDGTVDEIALLPIYRQLVDGQQTEGPLLPEVRRRNIDKLLKEQTVKKFTDKEIGDLIRVVPERMQYRIVTLTGNERSLGVCEIYETCKTLAEENEQTCVRTCNEQSLIKISLSTNPVIVDFYSKNREEITILIAKVREYSTSLISPEEKFQQCQKAAETVMTNMEKNGIKLSSNLLRVYHMLLDEFDPTERLKKICGILVQHTEIPDFENYCLRLSTFSFDNAVLNIKILKGNGESLGKIEFYELCQVLATENEESAVFHCKETSLIKLQRSTILDGQIFYNNHQAAIDNLTRKVIAHNASNVVINRQHAVTSAIIRSGGSPVHTSQEGSAPQSNSDVPFLSPMA